MRPGGTQGPVRFEATNIQWPASWSGSGVHVVYGVLGSETHTKHFMLVVGKKRNACVATWHAGALSWRGHWMLLVFIEPGLEFHRANHLLGARFVFLSGGGGGGAAPDQGGGTDRWILEVRFTRLKS